jgi:hypothetical protein
MSERLGIIGDTIPTKTTLSSLLLVLHPDLLSKINIEPLFTAISQITLAFAPQKASYSVYVDQFDGKYYTQLVYERKLEHPGGHDTATLILASLVEDKTQC